MQTGNLLQRTKCWSQVFRERPAYVNPLLGIPHEDTSWNAPKRGSLAAKVEHCIELNKSGMDAVRHSTLRMHLPRCLELLKQAFIPVLGPPGTGKTTFMIDFVTWILEEHGSFLEGKKYVLFSAWTNIAVQILADAFLQKNEVEDVHLLMIGNGNKEWANRHPEIECLEWKDSKGFLDEFLQRNGIKIVFATLGTLNQGLASEKCEPLHGRCVLSAFDEFAQVCETDC